MKNSVAILSHLKAHRSSEPIYGRTAPGIREALGLSFSVVGSTLSRMKKSGLVAFTPSRMIIGKRPNGPLRGMNRPHAYDITPKGIEYLEVRL